MDRKVLKVKVREFEKESDSWCQHPDCMRFAVAMILITEAHPLHGSFQKRKLLCRDHLKFWEQYL
jgi:hypothetical protein